MKKLTQQVFRFIPAHLSIAWTDSFGQLWASSAPPLKDGVFVDATVVGRGYEPNARKRFVEYWIERKLETTFKGVIDQTIFEGRSPFYQYASFEFFFSDPWIELSNVPKVKRSETRLVNQDGVGWYGRIKNSVKLRTCIHGDAAEKCLIRKPKAKEIWALSFLKRASSPELILGPLTQDVFQGAPDEIKSAVLNYRGEIIWHEAPDYKIKPSNGWYDDELLVTYYKAEKGSDCLGTIYYDTQMSNLNMFFDPRISKRDDVNTQRERFVIGRK